jgi:serine/threonine protein kinase
MPSTSLIVRGQHEEATVPGGPWLVGTGGALLAPTGTIANRYELLELVGVGATGAVYRALDRERNLQVAMKVLRAGERAAPALAAELRLARRLQHENICAVYDVGEAHGVFFLTMQFAANGSLRRSLREGDRRSLRDRVADVRAVVDGLAAIHEAGIVHRDVKPENVLRMSDGRLVVSDFGLAVAPMEASPTGEIVGTPRYMAPEVVMGEEATTASDVWSLGVVMHEILFGVQPAWVLHRWRRTLRGPGVSMPTQHERALFRLCDECLSDELPHRPAHAGLVRRRLSRLLRHALSQVFVPRELRV